jgi:hypothetical protein
MAVKFQTHRAFQGLAQQTDKKHIERKQIIQASGGVVQFSESQIYLNTGRYFKNNIFRVKLTGGLSLTQRVLKTIEVIRKRISGNCFK